MRDIKFGRPIIGKEERKAVLEVLDGDILVHGPKAKNFESDFAAFVNGPHAVSMSSCTAALHLSYFHFGIGTGDEVIVPAQSHVATAHSVELTGAKPIFVDAEPSTGNIDISQIESRITERTKAISVVHFLGYPVNMEAIVSIAAKHNLRVIEDCALAIGSRYKGKHVGLFGDTGCFSFYPVKHFTTAEGGMLITNSSQLAETISRQKAFGVDRTVGERKLPGMYDVNLLGYNYRMNEIQAAIGIEQLVKLNGFLTKRKENFEQLEAELKAVEEITLFAPADDDFENSYYCFSILLNEVLTGKRAEVIEFLKSQGIGTSIYYPQPIPNFTYYQEKYGYGAGEFPVASMISNSSIALPVGPHLEAEDMAYIVEKVKEAIIKFK